jgi:hypothetical protein
MALREKRASLPKMLDKFAFDGNVLFNIENTT